MAFEQRLMGSSQNRAAALQMFGHARLDAGDAVAIRDS